MPLWCASRVPVQKFHRDIPATKVYAYGTSQETAIVPGPTIEAVRGVDTHVTWLNEIRDGQHMFVVDKTLLVANPAQGVPTGAAKAPPPSFPWQSSTAVKGEAPPACIGAPGV